MALEIGRKTDPNFIHDITKCHIKCLSLSEREFIHGIVSLVFRFMGGSVGVVVKLGPVDLLG